MYTNVNI